MSDEYEDSSDDDDNEAVHNILPFSHKLQRKMSLAGVMEQSAAERCGFAALLTQKLNILLMEDDIEPDASYVRARSCNFNPRRCSAESAPPHCNFKGKWNHFFVTQN